MASVWKRGNIWYISYENRHGKRLTISSKMRHERDAQTLANQLVTREMLAKHGVTDAAPDKFRLTDATPLSELLAVWEKDLVARGNTVKYAGEQHMQALEAFRIGGIEYFPQITASAVQIALGDLRKDSKDPKTGKVKKGASLSTLNHYLRSVKGFCRWLWTDQRVKADPVGGMRGYNVATDRRRQRRAMTAPEAMALYKATDSGSQLWKMTGEDRGMLYRVMLGTGFRVNEMRSLRGKSFLFNETPPIAVVAAGFSKRRREDRQPIREKLAKMVKKYMKKKGIGPDDPVFNLPDKPNRMFIHDMGVAGIPITDSHGRVLDLHSLRHTFITECARLFSPKITQQLARHSSIVLSMDFYTHLEDDAASNALKDAAWFDEKKARGG